MEYEKNTNLPKNDGREQGLVKMWDVNNFAILLCPENTNVLENLISKIKNELVMLFWLSGTLKSSNWVTFFLVKLASFLKYL